MFRTSDRLTPVTRKSYLPASVGAADISSSAGRLSRRAKWFRSSISGSSSSILARDDNLRSLIRLIEGTIMPDAGIARTSTEPAGTGTTAPLPGDDLVHAIGRQPQS